MTIWSDNSDITRKVTPAPIWQRKIRHDDELVPNVKTIFNGDQFDVVHIKK